MTDKIKNFWSVNPENGKLSPEILDTYLFLQGKGFRKRTLEGEIELFRQNGYMVEQSFDSDQINEVIGYLKNDVKEKTSLKVDFPRKGEQTFEYTPKEILEKFVKYGWGKIFNEKNFNHLPELQVSIKRHTRDKAFFYFKNGFVEVTRKGVTLHPYSAFEGQYIYKDYLIDRNIQLVDVDDSVIQDFSTRGFSFLDFLNRLAGVPKDADKATHDQQDKLKYLLESIGFLLHDYKQQGLTDFCIIICDDEKGGTGKGIIGQALRQMTAVAEIDARKNEKFDPHELTERTRIKIWNDVQQGFQLGTIYNEITEPAVIRPMWKTPRYVPYKDSFKTLVLANYIVRGNLDADLRRQRVFSVNPFFSRLHTPRDEYKHSFFSEDWQENDWNFFYNTMFKCVQMWLNSDYKIEFIDQDYIERKMEEEYPMEFRGYMDTILSEVATNGTQIYKTADLYYKFKEHERYKISPFVRKLTDKFFSKLLRRYLEEMKIPFDKNHNRTEIWIGKK